MTATERRELLPCTCDAWETSGYSSRAFPSHDWKGCPFCLTPLRVKEPEPEPEYPTVRIYSDHIAGSCVVVRRKSATEWEQSSNGYGSWSPWIFDDEDVAKLASLLPVEQLRSLGTLAGMVMPRAEPTYTRKQAIELAMSALTHLECGAMSRMDAIAVVFGSEAAKPEPLRQKTKCMSCGEMNAGECNGC